MGWINEKNAQKSRDTASLITVQGCFHQSNPPEPTDLPVQIFKSLGLIPPSLHPFR